VAFVNGELIFMQTKIYESTAHAIELPQLFKLKENFYAAAFKLMKTMPARYILNKAKEAGLISKGSTIVETSSGTFGLALAMICCQEGYKCILVSDPVIDINLKRRLEDLGARVEIVYQPDEIGGYQGARLRKLHSILQEVEGAFWPQQYDNQQNPESYSQFSQYIRENLGEIDCLIGTVGSGGSICGTSNFLRIHNPDLYVIGIDTYGSVLFGKKDGKRILRGLGNSLYPKNLDHSIYNEVHWVEAIDAFFATRQLHRKYALFMGPTSGAAYMVGRWWSDKNREKKALIILPDEGYLYLETVYNDDWLQENNLFTTREIQTPELVNKLNEKESGWTYFNWDKRSLQQILKENN
jgi:cysteine synthase